MIPAITNIMTATTDMPNAFIQPVWNALLKTYIQATKAITIPTIVFSDGSGLLPIDNNDDNEEDDEDNDTNNLVETYNTIPYTMGPTAVTNIALVNFVCFALSILADIHTGIETITQIIKNEAIVIAIKKSKDSLLITWSIRFWSSSNSI